MWISFWSWSKYWTSIIFLTNRHQKKNNTDPNNFQLPKNTNQSPNTHAITRPFATSRNDSSRPIYDKCVMSSSHQRRIIAQAYAILCVMYYNTYPSPADLWILEAIFHSQAETQPYITPKHRCEVIAVHRWPRFVITMSPCSMHIALQMLDWV